MKILFSKYLIVALLGLLLPLNAKCKGDITLPVELVYFFAEVYEDSILLKFGTATEVSNYGFEIQRAQNGLSFEAIGFVDGNGNSNSPKDYTFVDSLVERSGIVYYRLKQIDFNGTFDYSDTVSVNFISSVKLENSSIPADFELSQNYPNPFNSITNFQFNISQISYIMLELYNVNGQKIKLLFSGELYPGTYSYKLQMDDFSSGTYLVKFNSKNYSFIKKILLLK
ncbi:MAG: T9SS type A sorting domain-containing protein [Ignavibacteriales bacterium]|nr:T9SS type A sorting domain-containing protein [Ignavibacteriales bacterium]